MSNDIYCIFPMELVTNERYKRLSSNSKILYCLFLNRTKFSKKNPKQFSDEKGVLFITLIHKFKSIYAVLPKLPQVYLKSLKKRSLLKKNISKEVFRLKFM